MMILLMHKMRMVTEISRSICSEYFKMHHEIAKRRLDEVFSIKNCFVRREDRRLIDLCVSYYFKVMSGSIDMTYAWNKYKY